MPTKQSETVNGRTVKLKNYGGKWWVSVDGHRKTPELPSKREAKREFDRVIDMAAKRPGRRGTNYGERTVDDALGF